MLKKTWNTLQPMRPKQARRSGSRGDTLIEVLFAITVFSLVVVLSISIMNQGTATSTRSLQISLVRQQIDSQAEMLRFMNAAYVAAFNETYTPSLADGVTTPAEEYYRISRQVDEQTTPVTAFGESQAGACPQIPSSAFILDTRNARFKRNQANVLRNTTDSYPQAVYDSNGIGTLTESRGLWIEAQRTRLAGQNNMYTDFHIRACWAAPGLNDPMNLGTIVRVYEPTR